MSSSSNTGYICAKRVYNISAELYGAIIYLGGILMAFEFMILEYLYFWTWYLWPFVFTFSLAKGIALRIKDEEAKASKISLIIAGFSFLVILAGITP